MIGVTRLSLVLMIATVPTLEAQETLLSGTTNWGAAVGPLKSQFNTDSTPPLADCLTAGRWYFKYDPYANVSLYGPSKVLQFEKRDGNGQGKFSMKIPQGATTDVNKYGRRFTVKPAWELKLNGFWKLETRELTEAERANLGKRWRTKSGTMLTLEFRDNKNVPEDFDLFQGALSAPMKGNGTVKLLLAEYSISVKDSGKADEPQVAATKQRPAWFSMSYKRDLRYSIRPTVFFEFAPDER